MTVDWDEIADRVFVWREPVLNVNAVLILGTTGALLVDTLSTPAQAAALAAGIARRTALSLQVVNTHAHFDHWFGNSAVAPPGTPVWAHSRFVERLAVEAAQGPLSGEARQISGVGGRHPDLAGAVGGTYRPPDHAVTEHTVLDLGDRSVDLNYLGRAHTDHDLIVTISDAGVVCAGDLVEQGAPPAFEDAYPLEWSGTVARLLDHIDTIPGGPEGRRGVRIVPGHGAVVGRGFVAAQHSSFAELEWLCRQGHYDQAPAAEIAARSPFNPDASRVAVERAYAALDGRL
jgi:glyoxylase-like metal-dependent hydrolase (beta-lactamase superfamily II)